MSRPVIALTTDFGLVDGYVGTMKGVILGICPEVTLVDISHEIRPQAVRQAAYVLSAATPYFPPGTIHLVVVDPGVGSERRPIVVQTERATYVAPDNGALSLVLSQEPARLAIQICITESRYRLPLISGTFHGRDIFAPVAAHLACGVEPHEIGDPLSLSDLVILPALQPQRQADGTWLGEVFHIDRFGNLITNYRLPIPPGFASATIVSALQTSIRVGGEQIVGLSRTYTDVEPGELVSYVGSSGYLEIAVREGNAAARLGVDVGDPVQIKGWP
jgi:S-adenosylmethionine hydrolase